jgi:hypothetical protein
MTAPALTQRAIERMTQTTGLRPILCLEEIDKFNPTVPRLKYLYGLINSVYKAGGYCVDVKQVPCGTPAPPRRPHRGGYFPAVVGPER